MGTAGLLLAAGGGRRMGGPKALVEFEGQRLVERGVRLLRSGGCDPVHVVLGAAYETVAEVVAPLSVVVVRNPLWETGMGSSLRTGLQSLPPDVEAVVIALVDQPLIGAEAVRRLLRTAADGTVAAVATYAGKPRNPVLLGRSVWSDVASLAVGDKGARVWLRAHPELVEPVPCDDTGSPVDIDTPADLERHDS
jgi:CTP:molybdopterin cytidylyltransferase MocA